MAILVTNNASAEIALSLNPSDTTIILAAGQGAEFPSPGASDYFYATLVDSSNNLEIVKCTSRSADTLTVLRGQDNTTARSFAAGSLVELRIVAATFTDLQAEVSPQFPSGTKLLFQQSTAPTGWTKDVTHDNKALRVVSGTAGSGGTVAFTAAFTSQSVAGVVGNTTLTIDQIPNHSHGLAGYVSIDGGGSFGNPAGSSSIYSSTFGAGGGGSHTHSFTGTAIDLAVQYVDTIIASKD